MWILDLFIKSTEMLGRSAVQRHLVTGCLLILLVACNESITEEDALANQAAGSEPKKVQGYDSGHGLPTQTYIDMARWLGEQIGIDESRFRLST
jgi:hypothetical protein